MSQINELPNIIKDFLKNLEKKIDYTLNHTIDRNIPKTNNLIELIYRTTFPGKIKRIFRTLKGAKRQIKANNIRWMEKKCFRIIIKFYQLNFLQSHFNLVFLIPYFSFLFYN